MTAELGRLDAAASLIPSPRLVARIATRREAIGTSALEGTYADLTDLFAAEVLPASEQDTEVAPNVREVMNYARAADSAYAWIRDRPITLGLISALQAQIVRGTSSDGPDAGSFRETQVFIGAKNRRVSEARFIPPPPGDQFARDVRAVGRLAHRASSYRTDPAHRSDRHGALPVRDPAPLHRWKRPARETRRCAATASRRGTEVAGARRVSMARGARRRVPRSSPRCQRLRRLGTLDRVLRQRSSGRVTIRTRPDHAHYSHYAKRSDEPFAPRFHELGSPSKSPTT